VGVEKGGGKWCLPSREKKTISLSGAYAGEEEGLGFAQPYLKRGSHVIRESGRVDAAHSVARKGGERDARARRKEQ